MAQAAVAARVTGSNTQGPGQPTETIDRITTIDTTDETAGTVTAKATSPIGAVPATRETTIKTVVEANTAQDKTTAADKTIDAMTMGAGMTLAVGVVDRATAGSRLNKTSEEIVIETTNIIREVLVGAESTKAGEMSAPFPRVRPVQVVFKQMVLHRGSQTLAPANTPLSLTNTCKKLNL